MPKVLIVNAQEKPIGSVTIRPSKRQADFLLEDWDDAVDKALLKAGFPKARGLTYAESYLESHGHNLTEAQLSGYYLIAWIY